MTDVLFCLCVSRGLVSTPSVPDVVTLLLILREKEVEIGDGSEDVSQSIIQVWCDRCVPEVEPKFSIIFS